MDSGQNPTSPMPGNGSNSATPSPVFSSATATLNSRRNRSARPASANSMVTPVQPMSPAGEAIPTLPTAKPKSPVNKGLIIGLIVLAVAAVAGVVALALIPASNGNNEQSVQSPIQKDYNKFANYFFHGSDSSTQPQLEAPADGYYYERAMYFDDNNQKTSFIEKSDQLFNSLKLDIEQTYDNINSEDSDIRIWLNLLSDDYTFARDIISATHLQDSDIAKQYLNQGRASTIELINNAYAPLVDSANRDSQDLGKKFVERDNIIVSMYDIYAQGGCIANHAIVDNCINKLDYSSYDSARRATLQKEIDVMELGGLNAIQANIIDFDKNLSAAVNGSQIDEE